MNNIPHAPGASLNLVYIMFGLIRFGRDVEFEFLYIKKKKSFPNLFYYNHINKKPILRTMIRSKPKKWLDRAVLICIDSI